ncbi:MAG: hypothetical protein N3A56_07985, partial [Thermodesulfobacteriaceae bacterium]|nr:hypothetical protein [Thermodesulfobacteriaceae bacterium]
MKLKNLILGILLFGTVSQGFAKVTTVEEIEEVVIIGEKVVKDKHDISVKGETLPASVHVITKEEIEKMSVRHYICLLYTS